MGAIAAVALWLAKTDSLPGRASLPAAAKAAAPAVVDLTPAALWATQFPDLDGRMQALGKWQGKLLILNFWATWCAPCVEEIPLLVAWQHRYAANNVQFVGIAADNSANVAKFKRRIDIDYPVLVEESGALAFAKRLGNRFGLLPYTVAVSPSGEVVFTKLGVVQESEIAAIVAKFAPK